MFALMLNPAMAAVVTFETVPLAPQSYWNGSDNSGGITLDGTTFTNHFTDWGGGSSSWSGFAISNTKDTATADYTNQYSACTGGGAGTSANYAVGYYSTYDVTASNVTFASLTDLTGQSAAFTNTTYAALSMLKGDGYAKKFGGVSGNDADWFRLTLTGYAAGVLTGTVDFMLADFRFTDNALDYIVHDWQQVDLTPLGSVDEVRFSMASSDNSHGAMNTPSYFAMDNFPAVPEPSAWWLALSGIGLLARRKR
jgi:hypothetical protein